MLHIKMDGSGACLCWFLSSGLCYFRVLWLDRARDDDNIEEKPARRGVSASTSAYVQLSRATSLDRVSIMQPFNIADLSAPLPQELIDELRWQEEMAENTLQMLRDDTIVMDLNGIGEFLPRKVAV